MKRNLLILFLLCAAANGAILKREWNQKRDTPVKAYMSNSCPPKESIPDGTSAVIAGFVCDASRLHDVLACINTRATYVCHNHPQYAWRSD
jgi:hypothetical protein